MFNLFGRNKQSRKTRRSNPNTPRLAKRQLFMESLEDRRLLAADVTFLGFHIDTGSGPGVLVGALPSLNEGDIVTVDIEVDELSGTAGDISAGDLLTSDVDLQLSLTTVVGGSLGTLLSDISVANITTGLPVATTQHNLLNGVDAEGVFNFTVTVGQDTTVELDIETFSMNILGGDNPDTVGDDFNTDFGVSILDVDTATITLRDKVTSDPNVGTVAEGVAGTVVEWNLDNGIELAGGAVIADATFTHAGSGASPATEAITGNIGDDDYDFTSLDISLDGGIGAGNFDAASFNTNADGTVEANETFDISGNTIPPELQAFVTAGDVTIVDTVTYTITSDDIGTITLRDVTTGDADAVTIAEDDGVGHIIEWNVTAPIELPAGTAAATTNSQSTASAVDFDATEAITGNVGDEDYALGSIDVVLDGGIAAGQFNAATVIAITDTTLERDETFEVLSDTRPAALNSLIASGDVIFEDQIVYTITNNDTVALNVSASSDGLEDGGAFSVDLTLSDEVELYGLGDIEVTARNDQDDPDGLIDRTADFANSGYAGDSDYTVQPATTLSYDGTAGDATEVITTAVDGDAIVEHDETFFVTFEAGNLRGYTAADIAVTVDGTALVIGNDETATVTHTVTAAPVAEGDNVEFDITLSAHVQTATFINGTADTTPRLDTDFATGDAVIGDIDPADQLATSFDGASASVTTGDNDYTETSQTWSYEGTDAMLPAELTTTIVVNTTGDDVVELREIFRGNYTENGGGAGYLAYGLNDDNTVQLVTSPDIGQIREEDEAFFNIALTLGQDQITEGTNDEPLTKTGRGGYDVFLDGDVQDYVGAGFTVTFSTADGNIALVPEAIASSPGFNNGENDYDALTETLTFSGDSVPLEAPLDSAGETETSSVIQVREDETVELDEVFSINIAVLDFNLFELGTGSGQLQLGAITTEDLTILNDDAAHLEISDITVEENGNLDGSPTTVAVSIVLDYPLDVPVGITYSATDGLALHTTDPVDLVPGNSDWNWGTAEGGTPWLDFKTNNFFAGVGMDAGVEADADPDNGSYADTITVTFDIFDDDVVELNENFFVNIFDLTQDINDAADSVGDIDDGGADDGGEDPEVAGITDIPRVLTIADDDGVVTILDDDVAVITLTVDDADPITTPGIIDPFTEAGGTATLTVSVSNPLDVVYGFDVMTQDGTAASAAGDYTPTTTSFTVAAPTSTTTGLVVDNGSGAATFTVPVSADGVVEVPETILAFVNNINAQGRNISMAAPETLTVTSADTATLDINDVTVIEGDEGQTLVQMTVTLSNAVSSPVSVVYTTNDGTAVDAAGANYGGDDYDDTDTTDGSITFVGEAGEQQKINVYVNGDVVVEDDETLTVDLGAVTAIAGVSVGDGSGNLNILNGADAATISIQTASSVLEGDTGAANTGDLIVTLSNPVDTAVAYDFATNDVDAVGDVAPVVGTHDYTTSTGAAQTFTGALGSSLTQTISVPVTGDDLVELDETFQVTIDNLDNPLGRAVTLPAATDTGTVTIVNDDAATVSITDITVNEDVGTATLTISLSAVVDTDVNVDIATQDGTAVDSPQGALDSDYDAAATTPETFAAGETSKTFDVDINDENLVELEEFLSVIVSNLDASGRDVTVVDDTGIITIVDNDTAELSISLVTVPGTLTEDSGTVTFDIALSNPVAVPVTINYGGVNPLMPSSYDDFVGGAGSVTFETNENATQQVTLDVFDDAVVELDEDFTVQMFGLDAGAIQDADNTDVTIEPTAGETAEFTIIDNDSAIFSINDVSVTEDDHGHDVATLTVTLDTAVDVPVDVQFDTADGTAISSDDGFNGHSDFVAVAAGNLRFAGTAGETQTITIRFNGETVVELDEDFTATLSNVAAQGREVDITIPDPTGTVTIENDDSATVDIQEVVSVNEDAGTADLLVTLSAPVDVDVLVDADHQDDTATETGATAADDDYDTVDETLTYSNVSGSTRQFTVTVPIGIDNIVELDEAMQVVLSNLAASGRDVTIGNGSGDVNILNDDSAVVQIDDVVINEEAGSATLTLTLSAPVDTQTDVNWQTLDGTATAAFNDYIVDGATVSWTALDTTDKTITVTVNDDDIVELTETMHVGLEEAVASGRDVTVLDEVTETNNDTDIVGSGQVTIVNTDSSEIQINATAPVFTEGDDGITLVTFDVTFSEPIDIPVLINHASRNGDYNSNTNAALLNTNAIATDAEYAGVNSTADNQDPSDPIGEYNFVNAARADDHDYDETEGALNFAAFNDGAQHDATDPGLTQTITVPVYGDNVVELDEWFVQFIESSDNFGRDFSITQPEDYGWINNDDEAHVEISDVSLNEGTGGSKFFTFSVTLDNDVDVPIDVIYTTVDGSLDDAGVEAATDAVGTGFNGDADYTTTAGVLHFTGNRGIEAFETLLINVPVSSDNVVELEEAFSVRLGSIPVESGDVIEDGRDVTITDAIGVGTIQKDDTATVYINDVAVEEGDTGTTTATLTVSLSNPVDAEVIVPYTTNGGDATSGVDYVALNDQLTFGKLESDTRVLTIDVTVNGDIDFERHENLNVELGTLSTNEVGRDVSYNDDDSDPAIVDGRVDITNDDRNLENFIGDCNIQAEPGDVNVNGAARIAQWNFTLSDLDEPIDLVFDAAAATGETVEIGVPQVVDSRGRVVAPLKVGHIDELTIPDAQKSYGVFRLGNGQYTVVVPASNDTDGLIELASSMPGLLSATERTVTNAALQQTAGGVLQTQLGIRGVMPEVFNDRMGIDLGIDQYDACLDSDHNGFLTAFDLMTIDTNVGVDEPGVYFLEDRFTPANLLEVDPLGQDELSIAELFGFSLYQNPSQPLDVNADGNVSPIDALTVINSLNSEGSRSVLVLGDSDGDMGDYLNTQQYLYDTNGDFAITPIDVLSVINHLNGSAGGEGEAVSVTADDFFLGYGQDELATVAVEAPVAAAITSTGVDVENTYAQEQYTTPLQANAAWSESVDRVLSDMTDGGDADDVFESLLD